jgi:hypothetical protein
MCFSARRRASRAWLFHADPKLPRITRISRIGFEIRRNYRPPPQEAIGCSDYKLLTGAVSLIG